MKTYHLFLLLFLSFVSNAQVLLDHTRYFEIEPHKLSFEDSSLTYLFGVRLGENSQMFNKGAFSNTSVGFDSMRQLDSSQVYNRGATRSRNTALGAFTLRNIYDTRSGSAMGFESLKKGGYFTDYSVAVGSSSQVEASQNKDNVSAGAGSLQYSLHGDRNLAIGASAMFGNGYPNGHDNVAIGALANGLYYDGSGVFLGVSAGLNYYYGGAGSLTSIGAYANQAQIENFGIAIGTLAGSSFVRGTNISIGHRTHQKVHSYAPVGFSQLNIGLGYAIMADYVGLLNSSVLIGNEINDARSSELVIEGISNIFNKTIYGSFADRKVMIDASADDMDTYTNSFWVWGEASKNTPGNWASHSDRRLKTQISPMNSEKELHKILQMRGVNYRWKKDDSILHTGFIAQDIQKVYPEKVETDRKGYLMTAYSQTDAYLLEAIRALNSKLSQMEVQLEQLNETDHYLTNLLNQL